MCLTQGCYTGLGLLGQPLVSLQLCWCMGTGVQVGLHWYDVDNFEVVVRALKMVGVNLSVSELLQYGDSILKTGQ